MPLIHLQPSYCTCASNLTCCSNMQTDHFAHYSDITTRHPYNLARLYILDYSTMH